ncbi:oxidoreductase [candidate division MSBL1 archaeon SCGC-AAA259O05]|uniref:Oxidoreductase n=1 Tax=candidate division MSBL1 archaeon SCGC-AAA259O05 TaxID=1698271 RepID=A0A133V486_9EURY|nr:oxidoreductase [candidate division MSBL1 archaeon SCGC-AAA259O05]
MTKTDERLRTAIVGLGWVGTHQGRAIAEHPRGEVTAVCDLSEEQMKKFAGELEGDPKFYTDYEEMCRDSDIDAVFVGTPNQTHEPVGLEAIKNGKHVLMTKPLAGSEDAARRLVEAAENEGIVNMMSLSTRFDGPCAYLKDLAEDGYFEDLYYARAWHIRRRGIPTGFSDIKDISPDQGFIQKGGGSLRDIGVHVLDAAWALLGMPKPIAAMGVAGAKFGTRGEKFWDEARAEDFHTQDYGSGFVKFENGVGLQLDSFWASHHPEEKQIEIFGTKAGARLDPLKIFRTENEGEQDIDVSLPEGPKPFERIADHFIECVLDGEDCKAPLHQGLTVQRMLEAILESSEKGKAIYLD